MVRYPETTFTGSLIVAIADLFIYIYIANVIIRKPFIFFMSLLFALLLHMDDIQIENVSVPFAHRVT